MILNFSRVGTQVQEMPISNDEVEILEQIAEIEREDEEDAI